MNRRGTSPLQGLVFKLIIINIIFFILQLLTFSKQVIYTLPELDGRVPVPAITYYLGLIPAMITHKGFIWQIFTYMFLHDISGFAHIFFNMYALLIFGVPIEQAWGGRRFIAYYLFCGVGAGLTIFLINLISGGIGFWIPTIGASGAVFGLLLAFGVLYPDAEILLFFFVPIKAKYLVILYGLLELYLEVSGGASNISHVGHLGGLFFGLVYFYLFRRRSLTFKSKVFKARMEKRISPQSPSIPKVGAKTGDRELKLKILEKLRQSGYSSLTDDEIQYIKYLTIMLEDIEGECPKPGIMLDDPECTECDIDDECFLREVEKYSKK